jgi:hypothetical protein
MDGGLQVLSLEALADLACAGVWSVASEALDCSFSAAGKFWRPGGACLCRLLSDLSVNIVGERTMRAMELEWTEACKS